MTDLKRSGAFLAENQRSRKKSWRVVVCLGTLIVLYFAEILVAEHGVKSIIPAQASLLQIFDQIANLIPSAKRFEACIGVGSTTRDLITASALLLPLKVLMLFAAFPFWFSDTDRLWSSYREGPKSVSQRVMVLLKRIVLLAFCFLPVAYVFSGFGEYAATEKSLRKEAADFHRLCNQGVGVYPIWFMYSLFATVPCLVFAAALRSFLASLLEAINNKLWRK